MGVTIAEYYRDMGYHALLLADRTRAAAERRARQPLRSHEPST